jgi:gluconate 2-dehydrogenase gamma chain
MNDEARPPLDEAEDGADLLSRKSFLGQSAAVAGSVALLSSPAAQASRLLRTASTAPERAYAPVALTAQEMTTLTAVLRQLLPKDELGPGAVEAGVHIYIDRALAGSLKGLLPVYNGYLPMFEKAAASMGATSFSALSGSQQIALLKQFEAGKPPGATSAEAASSAGLLQLLLEHMREGMFADPMYGGNGRLSGWNLIGFPGIKLVWTAKDQAIGTKVKPTNQTAKALGGTPYNGPAA